MRITDFPELVLPLGTDVLVGVDIVNDITKKIKLENLPVSIPTTAALNAKQNVLVSGTTIKTLNSISLLGSGDIVLTANASGVAGAVQFSNGSAFSSDASNLFWDNTDKRLGVGTNVTTVGNATLDQVTQRIYLNSSLSQIAHYIGSTANGISGDTSLALFGLGTAGGFHGGIRFFTSSNAVIPVLAMIVDRNQNVGIGLTNSTNLTASARLHVIGSGATSATTALLVQNSAGTAALTVRDNLSATFGGSVQAQGFTYATVSELGGNCRVTTTNGANPQPRLFSAEGDAQQTTNPTTSFHDIRNFTPTSGSALYTAFQWSGTINQTGSANGIVRGLFINPTVTAAVDFRAIEVTNGNVLIGNSAPNTAKLSIKGSGSTSATNSLLIQNSAGNDSLQVRDDRTVIAPLNLNFGNILFGQNFWVQSDGATYIGASSSPSARLQVKGSGSTSATTSLLVQNSAGVERFKVEDGGRVYIGTTGYFLPDSQSTAMYNTYNKAVLTSSEISNIVKVLLANNTHSFCGAFGGVNGQVGINTNTPNASAALEVVSTTTGFLPPRMTTTQKNAIASPAAGLVVYDSTTNKLCCYNGSTWNDLF
jgi:hypothetical protein